MPAYQRCYISNQIRSAGGGEFRCLGIYQIKGHFSCIKALFLMDFRDYCLFLALIGLSNSQSFQQSNSLVLKRISSDSVLVPVSFFPSFIDLSLKSRANYKKSNRTESADK